MRTFIEWCNQQPFTKMPLFINLSNPVCVADFIDRFVTTYRDQTQKIPSGLLVRCLRDLCDGVLVEVPQKNLAQFRSSIEVLNESYADQGVQLTVETFHEFLQHLRGSPSRSLIPLFKDEHYSAYGVRPDTINAAIFPFELASWYEDSDQVDIVMNGDIGDLHFENEDCKTLSDSEDDEKSSYQISSNHPVYQEDPDLPPTLPYSPFFGSLEDPYFPPFSPVLTRQNASAFNLE